MARSTWSLLRGGRAVAGAVLVLSLAAVAVVILLQARADASRHAQDELGQLTAQLSERTTAPLAATFGSPRPDVQRRMARLKLQIMDTIRGLRADGTVPALDDLDRGLAGTFASQDAVGVLVAQTATRRGRVAVANPKRQQVAAQRSLLGNAERNYAIVARATRRAGSQYAARARVARLQATIGSAAAIAFLLLAFLFVYRRSLRERAEAERLAAENAALAEESRHEALTDALTGLGNRRALILALDEEVANADRHHVVLVLFDLDGFKRYNDTFGHQAGDALLRRLGEQLSDRLPAGARAFRMGGDEFCILARAAGAVSLARAGVEALSDHGGGFSVGCSYGMALAPGDATTSGELLRIADQRMYAQKAGGGRSSAGQQTADALEQVLVEQSSWADRGSRVANLASATAVRLGMAEHEVRQVQLAARLRNVGKAAISVEILGKPGRLDEDEQEFVRTHTIIGERILNAAPALSHIAALVRSSHERVDGGGYPDGLRGDQIPMGARIVTVCDAFDAMVSDRPYRAAMGTAEALDELRRCASAQFDAGVVAEVIAAVGERQDQQRVESAGSARPSPQRDDGI